MSGEANERLDSVLRAHGLRSLGVVDVPVGDSREGVSGVKSLLVGADARLVLVGNAGSSIWKAFREGPEFSDGRPDPLDRWSRRIGETVAGEVGAEAVFPFDGPPWPPFLSWAERSGEAFVSPISLVIHRRYGLWHSYRFALIFGNARHILPSNDRGVSPCLSCSDQPCLDACPVNAFSPGQYRVNDCLGFLRSRADSSCRLESCAARRACPVAPERTYAPEHARFHMNAFLRAQNDLD
jgi:hypothetical protein